MSQPINNNQQIPANLAQYGTIPDVPALPVFEPIPVPTSSPASEGPPAQLPDGTFTDAQFEQSMIMQNENQIAMDNMMFQQQMLMMQQKAAQTQRTLQAQQSKNNTAQDVKLVPPPEIKSAISYDEGEGEDGGDGGE